MPRAQDDFAAREHRRAFGRRIRELRAEREWTQEDLAEEAVIHRSYLASLETGERNPSLDVIVKIARGLGVPTADLFEKEPGLD